jgi:putative membrane protein insertion efficiency factor
MRQFPKFVVLQLLRGYKWAISPLLPPACRFIPTCSEYAQEAVERYGALRGAWMATLRLLRCHPFSRGGYDPVERNVQCVQPPHFSHKMLEIGPPTYPTTSGQRPTAATRAI